MQFRMSSIYVFLRKRIFQKISHISQYERIVERSLFRWKLADKATTQASTPLLFCVTLYLWLFQRKSRRRLTTLAVLAALVATYREVTSCLNARPVASSGLSCKPCQASLLFRCFFWAVSRQDSVSTIPTLRALFPISGMTLPLVSTATSCRPPISRGAEVHTRTGRHAKTVISRKTIAWPDCCLKQRTGFTTLPNSPSGLNPRSSDRAMSARKSFRGIVFGAIPSSRRNS